MLKRTGGMMMAEFPSCVLVVQAQDLKKFMNAIVYIHGKLDAGRLEAEKTLPERSISRISITSLWIRRACAGSQTISNISGKLDAGRLEAEKTLPECSISRISITSLWIRRACAGSQTITQPHHHLVSALTKGGASSPNKYPFVPYVPPCLLYNCKIPDNDDELCVPTSDPFEEEELARYSQRHETREYAETLITESLRRSGVKRVRRSLLGDNEKQSSLCSICNPGGHSAVASAQARNGEPDLPNLDNEQSQICCCYIAGNWSRNAKKFEPKRSTRM
ncbi:hypothetical protein R3P38DRAFT_2803804 [Favolaschia claudopus]|uniref:Uncharacterized protein n=1 Tax=Favolaschia claudopus TaxID=2862362 RepID=A0AAV9ZSJ1_9AGAR